MNKIGMVKSIKHIIPVSLLALCLLARTDSASVAPLPPQYTITDLGTLGGTGSLAWGINNKGQVVGVSSTGQPHQDSVDTHAFLWTKGQMQAITFPNTTLFSFAYAVNDQGVIVGTVELPVANPAKSRRKPDVGFLWKDGHVTQLAMDEAIAINNRGQIVGTRDSQSVPLLRDPSGKTTVLVPLEGDNSVIARGLNDLGWVVGASSNLAEVGGDTRNNTRRATLWKNGKALDLKMVSGTDSEAYAVNNKGQVVGASGLRATGNKPGASFHAFLWQNGKIKRLLGGDIFSLPDSINDKGQVVGLTAIGNSYEKTQAVLWQHGRMYILNNMLGAASGWDLTEARSINNKGQIVGEGRHNGHHRAFLLTPMGNAP